MTSRYIQTVAVALSLVACPVYAQQATEQTRAVQTNDLSAAETTDVRMVSGGGDAPQPDAKAVLASMERAARDTALRTRGAVPASGQTASGLGNVTGGIEVAGGTEISPEKVSVSGGGSVATGNN